jgi:hypothetical protein
LNKCLPFQLVSKTGSLNDAIKHNFPETVCRDCRMTVHFKNKIPG